MQRKRQAGYVGHEPKEAIQVVSRRKDIACIGAIWEVRFSELADYRKVQGRCNVSRGCSENTKLGAWVHTQRNQYKLHLKGKASSMTLPRIQALEGVGFEWSFYDIASWEDRLTELADYRKIHGHCNVPQRSSENAKLGKWLAIQRSQYKLHLEGVRSRITTFRIQELESIGWKPSIGRGIGIPKRLSLNDDPTCVRERVVEASDHMQEHSLKKTLAIEKSTAIKSTSLTNPKYPIRMAKSTSPTDSKQANRDDRSTNGQKISPSESLPNESRWQSMISAWEDHWSELAEYRKIHGHCNVPQNYSGNVKLANWVAHQRIQYKLHVKEKKTYVTAFRIQKLESLGFEWDSLRVALEDRLKELADFRKIRGHCDVPKKYSGNAKLASWVTTQRKQYMLHVKGKPSHMTIPRIQALESLSFDWKPSSSWGKGTPKEASIDDNATYVRERIVEELQHVQTTAAEIQRDFSGRNIRSNQLDVAFVPEESDWNDEVHLGLM
jgi:hypothetical protein